MRLEKRGVTYYVCWTEQRRSLRQTTGLTDRKAAEIYFARWQQDRADPVHATARAATIGSAVMSFIKDRMQQGRAKATMGIYRQKCGHIVRIFGEHAPLASVTAASVDAFVEQRLGEGSVHHTVYKELVSLRGVLKLAYRRKEYTTDPARVLPVGFSARYKPRARFLTVTELEALEGIMFPAHRAKVLFMVATGCRISEMVSARKGDVRLSDGTVTIRGTKTAQSVRTVPVLSMYASMLKTSLSLADGEGDRLFKPWANATRDLPRYCERAGMARVSPNDLRRTHATWLVRERVPLDLVARMLGHASTAMVYRVYGRVDALSLGTMIEQNLGCAQVARTRADLVQLEGPSGTE